MNKNILLIPAGIKFLMVLLLGSSVNELFAQQYEIVNTSDCMFFHKQQVTDLNKRVLELLEKSSCNPKTEKLVLEPVFLYKYYGNFNKEDFLQNVYLQKLIVPDGYEIGKKDEQKYYIAAKVIVSDSAGNFWGMGDARQYKPVCKTKKNVVNDNIFLLRQKKKLNIKCLFNITGIPDSITFGLTDNEKTYVFESVKNKINVYDIDTFVNKRWGKWENL
ncbi:MAG: hypothetical protein LBR10_10185 [Prevotellaceae bacterium]|jgi:hypothetical protein|nr:hypothetical protein [Prevotellaceae bacterium]